MGRLFWEGGCISAFTLTPKFPFPTYTDATTICLQIAVSRYIANCHNIWTRIRSCVGGVGAVGAVGASPPTSKTSYASETK